MAFGESIKAFLGLDTAGFKAGLASAESSAGGLGRKLAGLFGATLGVAGIENAAKSLVEYGTKVQDLSDRFNVSAESLQRLGNAAELNGSSLEGMAKGFNKLEISQSRALGGNEKLVAAFASLGVTVDDLRKLSPEEIMLKLGKSSLNAADVIAILGKSALELRPTLAGLADGTVEFGKAIAAIDVQKLKEVGDAWKRDIQTVKAWGAGVLADFFRGNEIVNNKVVEGFHAIKNAGVNAWAAIREEGEFSWDKIFESKEENEKRDAAAETAKSKRKFAPEEAKAKEDQRLKFSLKEIADREALPSNTQSIQAWWAGQQARNVQGLDAKAKSQAIDDLTGATATQKTSDEMRQSISGLSDAEKSVGAFKTALADTNMKLDTIHMDLQLDE